MQQITHLETLTTSAWPALATELVDGWVLRFARGYTKRANSVAPLAVGALPNEEKIAYCEQRYAAQNLPAIFKLTAASQALDEKLAARGYSQIDLSSVQQRGLLHFVAEPDFAVRMSAQVSDTWFTQFAELNHVAVAHRATAQQMLASYVCPTQFAVLYQDERVVACGFAIIQQYTLVLYDIVSDSQQRRQGYALRLIEQLLAWGRNNGATSAVLQVVVANEPAMALYAKLGFTEQYRYWYRRQPNLRESDWIAPADYLALEMAASGICSEYHDGKIVAKALSSMAHSTILGNVVCALHPHLKGSACHVLMSNLRLRIEAANCYFYPDAFVNCDRVEPTAHTLHSAKLVVEVVSAETSHRDRTAKFDAYRQLQDLQEYVLIDSEQEKLEVYRRSECGDWLYHVYAMEDIAELASVELNLSMSELYEGVNFSPVATGNIL